MSARGDSLVPVDTRVGLPVQHTGQYGRTQRRDTEVRVAEGCTHKAQSYLAIRQFAPSLRWTCAASHQSLGRGACGMISATTHRGLGRGGGV